MPSEPPATTWTLERPPADHPHEVWALGADLEPGTLLAAYRLGLFPMPVEDHLAWWSPEERAVIPVTEFRASRSLRRAAEGYEIRVDTAFGEVIRGCADPRRAHGWIDADFVAAYTRLHELGWAHSIEVWSARESEEPRVVGGVYGVAIGGLFAGESMFHTETDASKVALAALVDRLRAGGGTLFDVQWCTPHLASLGAIEISRDDYTRRVADAITRPQLRL